MGDYTANTYHVEDGKPVKIPDNELGHFFGDDIYIIDLNGAQWRYLFGWLGQKVEGDEKQKYYGPMQILTDYTLAWNCTRQAIKKNHEDEAILSLYDGVFIIHDGNRIPLNERLDQIKANGAAYRCMSPFGKNGRAMETEKFDASVLNSGDVFVVCAKGGDVCYIWHGAGSNEVEQEIGNKVAARVAVGYSETKVIKEHEEPEHFWEVLGGKQEYANFKDLGIPPNFTPRLIQVNNSHGNFKVVSIPNFTQYDLLPDDVMILDMYETIFIWKGNKANKFELKKADTLADEYVEKIGDGRDPAKVQEIIVEAGQEPPLFQLQFPTWDEEFAAKWLLPDPIEEMMKNNRGTYEKAEKKVYDIEGSRTYTYEELKDKFPEGVNPAAKE